MNAAQLRRHVERMNAQIADQLDALERLVLTAKDLPAGEKKWFAKAVNALADTADETFEFMEDSLSAYECQPDEPRVYVS